MEDRQSRIAWQNNKRSEQKKEHSQSKTESNKPTRTNKTVKQHFENLFGNPAKITHEPITRIISKQLDIKLGPFTQEELDSVLRKIKNRKLQGWTKFPRKYGSKDNRRHTAPALQRNIQSKSDI